MIRRYIAAIRAATAVIALTVPTAAQSTAQLDHRSRAADLIRRGELAHAEAELNAALLVLRQRIGTMFYLLGVVRAQQGRISDAEEMFRRAIAATPSHLGAYINLGELYLTTARPERALEVLRAAHELAPERPDINLNLASLYEEKRDFERAVDHLRRIPRAAANAEYYYLLFRSLLELGRRDDARALAREFASFAAAEPEDRARIGMLLARGGLNDEALVLLEAAHSRAPDSFPVSYALGVVSAAAKRFDKAEEALSSALRVKPDDVSALRSARAYRARSRRPRKGTRTARSRAPNRAGEPSGVLYEFGATALEMDLLIDALPVFEQLHKDYPGQAAYLYGLAAVRLRKGDRADAARLMKEYVVARPKDASGLYLLGAALHSLNQFAEARAALERSLELLADTDTEYLLGVTRYDAGDRTGAIEMLRRVVQARPELSAAHTALGTAYRDEGNFESARGSLERAIALDPKDLRAHYQLGLVYGKLGEKEAAKRMLDRAEVLRSEQRSRETVRLKLVDPPE